MLARTAALLRKCRAAAAEGQERELGAAETLGACLGSETLSSVLEGRADAAARARVAEHASRCASCRHVLSSLARTGTPVQDADRALIRGRRAIAPGTILGRYVITGEIATGGMGVVYQAHDPELHRPVAIKLLRGDSDSALQERLRREAQVMAQLAHANVVTVFDVGVFEDELFIAMEYVEGQTLASWIEEPRSPHDVLEVFRAAGRGLAAAHAAGIVHRDFKPENVLIGADGRVRVGDFGLARPGSAHASSALPLAAGSQPIRPVLPAPIDLTVTGTLLGTPRYLAPELYRGAEADARSDQFSFCVALFTALHGVPPFEGETLDALAASVCAGTPRDPGAVTGIPRRIRRAIRRRLELDPGQRFASLDDLLVELARPLHHRVRRAVALGAVIAAATTWLVARAPADPREPPCTGASAAFAAAWNPQRRQAIAAAFSAVHKPYAAAALRGVTEAIDRLAAQWAVAHTDACRATRIRGDQTESMLDLRMACLERRRQEAAALVDTLAAADADAVTRSVAAANGLVDVAACADLAMLRQLVPPPSDTITRGKLAALTPRLAEARAGLETGAYAHALALVRPVVGDARALGYRPFEAEAELVQAQLEKVLGDLAGAEASFEAAIWAAEAGRHDELAARAWSELVLLVGYQRSEFARGAALLPRATAALARLGGHPDLEAGLERALDAIDFRKHELDSAVGHAERALALEERVHGPDHLHVAMALESLGTTMMEQRRLEPGLHTLQRALQIYERLLGPDHPSIAHLLSNLGNADLDAGNSARAEQELRRALAICEAAFGPDHPETARALSVLGRAMRAQGRSAEAVVLFHRAVAANEKRFGAESPQLERPLFGLGLSLAHVGRYDEADVALRRASDIAIKVRGPGDVWAMRATAARGDTRMRQSQWREAAALYERVIPVLEKAPGTREDLVDIACSVGRAYIELHRPARALDRLERIARTLDDLSPPLRVSVEFTLARALWDSGGDRTRARDLATRAAAGIHQISSAHRDDILQIERWLADHRAR
jgi:tetratricopeptide (TPR) repeat protein/predicted Ser/Thr protein kinase